MKYLLKLYKENKAFVIPYLLFVILALTARFLYDKASVHIFINSHNSPIADQIFYYLTYLGTGWALIVAIVLLVFVKRGTAGGLLLSGLVMNLVVQTLKYSIESFRPVRYFAFYVQDYSLHLVEGVKMHYVHSFPSGHAATAFAIFFFLSGLTKNNVLKFTFFVIALAIAFSRVYLSQHFLLDIVAGSAIGVLSSTLGLWWTDKYPQVLSRERK